MNGLFIDIDTLQPDRMGVNEHAHQFASQVNSLRGETYLVVSAANAFSRSYLS